MMLHVESSPVTAAQITENCPAKLVDLGNRIVAHLTKAAKADQKANDHRIAAGQLLAQARETCDEGGFTAFREQFCPNLGKSRAHELLAIASGKKSVEQIRADNAARNRKHRANKKAAEATVRHVTETPVTVKVTAPTESLFRATPRIDEAQVLPSKRLTSERMSPDQFMYRAFPQLDAWCITLAEMAESNPSAARECVEWIVTQLHDATNNA